MNEILGVVILAQSASFYNTFWKIVSLIFAVVILAQSASFYNKLLATFYFPIIYYGTFDEKK